MKEEAEKGSKERLMAALANMESAVNKQRERVIGIDESAERI